MSEAVAVSLAEIRHQTLEWLWEPFLPRGKLVLLDGDPGIGKSLITIDLAARLSRGFEMPRGAPATEPQTTLLIASEDDAADTTRPRAEAADADLSRVIVVTGPHGIPLQFPADLDLVAQLTRRHRPALIVIDPIVACLPESVATASDQAVRRVLTVLANLAERSNATILMNRHLKKAGARKALYRGAGSIGFIASVRTALFAARHPSDPTLGVLSVSKSNLATVPPSLGYHIVSDTFGRPMIQWTGIVDVDADRLGEQPTEVVKPRDRASMWLQRELENGPRKASEMFLAAAALGIPERTLRRAKADLHLGSKQMPLPNGGKEWYWYDSDAPWPKNAPFKKPYELPPLPDLDEM